MGRARRRAGGDLAGSRIDLGRAIARVDRLLASPAKYISLRDVMVIGPDRREIEMRTSSVIEAFEDGVDRILVAKMAEDADLSAGDIVAEKSCRVGRVRKDDEHKLLVAEIILDRVLGGGTPRSSTSGHLRPRRGQRSAARTFVRPARLRDGGRVPPRRGARALSQLQPVRAGRTRVDTGELWIGTTASTHLVVHEAQAGSHPRHQVGVGVAAPSCNAAAPATSGAAIDVPLLDSVAMSLPTASPLPTTSFSALAVGVQRAVANSATARGGVGAMEYTNLDRSGPPVPGR